MAVDDNPLEALSAPLGELIASVGRGVADAQRALDAASLAALREIYESDEALYRELQAIGYRPTWYHIPEAEGEIQVALTATGTTSALDATPSSRSRIKLYAAPLDAGYTSRYNFSLTASSKLKFRIVPVPPSGAADAISLMPSLVGLQLGVARTRLSMLGIPATYPDSPGNTVVRSQSPPPGTVLAPDEKAEVATT